jgi:thiamine pyrophosphate-dependent acetolactate synthase large subunit-like protein
VTLRVQPTRTPNDDFGTDLLNPNFAKLAESVGLRDPRTGMFDEEDSLEETLNHYEQASIVVIVNRLKPSTPTPARV